MIVNQYYLNLIIHDEEENLKKHMKKSFYLKMIYIIINLLKYKDNQETKITQKFGKIYGQSSKKFISNQMKFKKKMKKKK